MQYLYLVVLCARLGTVERVETANGVPINAVGEEGDARRDARLGGRDIAAAALLGLLGRLVGRAAWRTVVLVHE